jgi:hypothetical protein
MANFLLNKTQLTYYCDFYMSSTGLIARDWHCSESEHMERERVTLEVKSGELAWYL